MALFFEVSGSFEGEPVPEVGSVSVRVAVCEPRGERQGREDLGDAQTRSPGPLETTRRG